MATKKQRDKAYQQGRDAADRGDRGVSPYEKSDPGWDWISGWEIRMGEIEKAKREQSVPCVNYGSMTEAISDIFGD